MAVDVAHTSVLIRAIRTLHLALEELGRIWIPVHRHWRLNERHYGALTGLDKAETRDRYGDEQFRAWRRSYDIPPPPIDPDSPWNPARDPRYAPLAPDVVPATECLKDVVARMLPYWYDAIVPDVRAGRIVLVAAHGNSLRALIKHLDGISDEDIPNLEIPTGVPIVYELDDGLRPLRPGGRWLGDPDAVSAAAEAVRRQGQR
jgi:2,3-bisphosphoglycerate-dependent phosphoglycerate mutase